MRKRKPTKMIVEMNVVPYIDVMLVLLVIFMITAPMITYGVKVELPKVSNAKAIDSKQEKSPLIVTIKENGDLFMVDKNKEKKATLKEIILKLKSHKIINPDRKAFIRGDSKVEYGKVVQVMTILQNNGIEKIGLITQMK
jgi:biopolymer transport protein TolR